MSRGDAAMTFQEIADALGVDRGTVLSDYAKAIYKLRQSQLLNSLMFLAALKEHMADQRQSIYPDW